MCEVPITPLPRRYFLKILGAMSSAAWAESMPLPVAAPRSITAVLVNIPPWTHIDAHQQLSGIMVEIITELQKRSNVTIGIRIFPYPRELLMLEKTSAVLTIAFHTEKVAQLAQKLAKLDSEDVIVVSHKGMYINSITDLRGKVVAQIRNADYLTRTIAEPSIRKYDTNGYQQSVKMLLENRVDAIVGLRTSLSYAIAQNSDAVSRLSPPLRIASGELCLFLSRNFTDQNIIHRLEVAAKSLVSENLIRDLRKKYSSR
jgi:hypothetical protein